jgi:hypothetical protein
MKEQTMPGGRGQQASLDGPKLIGIAESLEATAGSIKCAVEKLPPAASLEMKDVTGTEKAVQALAAFAGRVQAEVNCLPMRAEHKPGKSRPPVSDFSKK